MQNALTFSFFVLGAFSLLKYEMRFLGPLPVRARKFVGWTLAGVAGIQGIMAVVTAIPPFLKAIAELTAPSPAYAHGNLYSFDPPQISSTLPNYPTELPKCVSVVIFRDISASTSEFSIRFRTDRGDGTVAGLSECIARNSGDVLRFQEDPAGGMKVRLAVRDGTAKVSLPRSFAEGVADQVVCSIDPISRVISHQKYVAAWSNGLPTRIKLDRADSYDRAAADTNCRKAFQ